MFDIFCLQRQHLKPTEYNIGDEISKRILGRNYGRLSSTLPNIWLRQWQVQCRSQMGPMGLKNIYLCLKIENDVRKRAVLLHYADESVYDMYDAEKGATETTQATKQVLTTYFEPKKNTQMEVFKFHSYKQKECQSLDEFIT